MRNGIALKDVRARSMSALNGRPSELHSHDDVETLSGILISEQTGIVQLKTENIDKIQDGLGLVGFVSSKVGV